MRTIRFISGAPEQAHHGHLPGAGKAPAPRRAAPMVMAMAILMMMAACSSSGDECSLLPCNPGLTIELNGTPPAGQAAEVEVAVVTATETIPFARCDWANDDEGSVSLRCTSQHLHSESGGSGTAAVWLHSVNHAKVRVTVTHGMTTIAEGTFTPAYTSTELNGPGCGLCTAASVAMTIP